MRSNVHKSLSKIYLVKTKHYIMLQLVPFFPFLSQYFGQLEVVKIKALYYIIVYYNKAPFLFPWVKQTLSHAKSALIVTASSIARQNSHSREIIS